MTTEVSQGNTDTQSKRPQDEKLWSPVFIIIIGATLCAFLVGQGSNSGTSVYLANVGGTATLAGIGAAAFSAAAAFTRLFSGPIIDSRGRKIVMVFGAAVMLLGTLGPLAANDGALFIFWRLLQGLGFSAATTASATAAADVLPLSRLGEGIGYYGLGQALSMSIGPAIALFLASTNPPENLYLGLSCSALLTLVFALFCRYEKNPTLLPQTSSYRKQWEQSHIQTDYQETLEEVRERSAEAETVKGKKHASHTSHQKISLSSILEKRALPGTIPMMIISPAFGFGIFFFGLFGTTLGVGNAGLFYTISAISMILIRLKSKSFMDKVPAFFIMTAAVVCGLIAYSMLFAAGILGADGIGEIIYYLAGVFYGLSLGIALPINQTVAVRYTPADHWGAANALYQLGSDVGIGLSSIVWGIINDNFGFNVTLGCVMCCIAASLVAAWICYPQKEKRRK